MTVMVILMVHLVLSGGCVDMSDIFGGGFGGFGDILILFGGSHGVALLSVLVVVIWVSGCPLRFEEAAAGVTKTISYNRLSKFAMTVMALVLVRRKIEDCPRRHGTGTVVQVQNTVFGQMQSQTVCPECQGTGKKVEHACETCGGQGRTLITSVFL